MVMGQLHTFLNQKTKDNMKKIFSTILVAVLLISCSSKKSKNQNADIHGNYSSGDQYTLELMCTSPEGVKIYRVWNNDHDAVINRLAVSADGKSISLVENTRR